MWKRLKRHCVLLGAALLAACGGGGGGGSEGGSPTISGHVVKGPVSGATVVLSAVAVNGSATILAQTRSASDGSYEFRIAPPVGSVFLVEATGGTFVDEATRATVSLSLPLRAAEVWSGAPRQVVLTAYSEAAVRFVERGTGTWSGDAVRAANARVSAWIGLDNMLAFRPIDLTAATIPSNATSDDLTMSLMSGAVSTLVRRVDGGGPYSLAGALEAIYRVAVDDPADDRLGPAFVGALADFVDLMSLGDADKLALKSALVLGANTPVDSATLQRMLPHGVSSGAATAAMPDDAFELAGHPGGKTRFNKRGALVASTSSAATDDWQAIYTASVAELYGDGDVGIGRWNGGAIFSTVNLGGSLQTGIAPLPYDALHYALARPASALPPCGLRRLAWIANTNPTVQSESVGATLRIKGLTTDSMVGVQYLGSAYMGADIGVRLQDDSVVRFRSIGGVDAPWASLRPLNQGEHTLEAVGNAGVLAGQSLSVTALLSGSGANKLAVRLRLSDPLGPTEMAAVFGAPVDALQSKGCGGGGDIGPGISPLPANGWNVVSVGFNNDYGLLGMVVESTFGPQGELLTFNRGLNLAAPFYELAGNATGSIGRGTINATVNGQSVTRTAPYVVVQPATSVPAVGTVVYDLMAATAAVVALGSDSAQVPAGRVNSATLEMVYGQYPPGTPSAGIATARLRVDGVIDGLPFWVGDASAQPGNGPAETLSTGAQFSAGNFTGAVSAPDGEYAVAFYIGSAKGTSVQGALLLRRRP